MPSGTTKAYLFVSLATGRLGRKSNYSSISGSAVQQKRLVPLRIMGDQLRVPLRPPDTIVLWCLRGFRGPSLGPQMMLRDAIRLMTQFFLKIWGSCKILRKYIRNIPNILYWDRRAGTGTELRFWFPFKFKGIWSCWQVAFDCTEFSSEFHSLHTEISY